MPQGVQETYASTGQRLICIGMKRKSNIMKILFASKDCMRLAKYNKIVLLHGIMKLPFNVSSMLCVDSMPHSAVCPVLYSLKFWVARFKANREFTFLIVILHAIFFSGQIL